MHSLRPIAQREQTGHRGRPDKLYAHRIGGYADVALFFNGKQMSIYAKSLNAYAQFEGPASVDQLLDALAVGHGVARRTTRRAVTPGVGAGGVGGPASGVGVLPGAGAGQAGVGYSGGVGVNLGGPVNRVGVR